MAIIYLTQTLSALSRAGGLASCTFERTGQVPEVRTEHSDVRVGFALDISVDRWREGVVNLG